MFVLTVFGEKGGAGKTTLAVEFALYGARMGAKTLLLDADPQASATSYIQERRDFITNHSTVLANLENEITRLQEQLHETRNADDATEGQLIPIRDALAAVRKERNRIAKLTDLQCPDLITITGGNITAQVKAAVSGDYDWVVMDTPGRDTRAIRECALNSDFAIIPLRPSKLDTETASEMNDIAAALLTKSKRLKGAAFVLNQVPTNKTQQAQAEGLIAAIAQLEPTGIISSVVHLRTGPYPRAVNEGLSVAEIEGGAKAASEIEAVLQEVLAMANPEISKGGQVNE